MAQIFYNSVPDRVKKIVRAWNDSPNSLGFKNIRVISGETSFSEVIDLMNESWLEMRALPTLEYLTRTQIDSYILEWSFYLHQLACMKHVDSDANERHILANMHLRNFGVPTSGNNSRLKSLLFYSPAPSFVRRRLYIESKDIYSKSDPLLQGRKDTYLDHHERLFAEIESLLASCIREYVNPKGEEERPIAQAIREEIRLAKLMNRLHFKLIIAIYILIVDMKYNLRGKENHETLNSLLKDVGRTSNSLALLFNRHWIWSFANDGGEMSLLNRGVVNIPEFDDAFFMSISRVWGLWVMSTKDSNEYMAKFPQAKNSRIQGIKGIGADIGYKMNLYMKNIDNDRELIYPYAKKLSFHPDLDINSLPVISKKEIEAEKWKKKRVFEIQNEKK